MKIYAAVIEWGESRDDHSPELILAPTWGGMADQVRATVLKDAMARTSTEEVVAFQKALDEMSPLGWDDWRAELPFHDEAPFITTYQREI